MLPASTREYSCCGGDGRCGSRVQREDAAVPVQLAQAHQFGQRHRHVAVAPHESTQRLPLRLNSRPTRTTPESPARRVHRRLIHRAPAGKQPPSSPARWSERALAVGGLGPNPSMLRAFGLMRVTRGRLSEDDYSPKALHFGLVARFRVRRPRRSQNRQGAVVKRLPPRRGWGRSLALRVTGGIGLGRRQHPLQAFPGRRGPSLSARARLLLQALREVVSGSLSERVVMTRD